MIRFFREVHGLMSLAYIFIKNNANKFVIILLKPRFLFKTPKPCQVFF